MNTKILTGLVALLGAAVIYLFVTMPSSGSKEETTTTENSGQDAKENGSDNKEVPTIDLSGDGKVVIAYVDGDMINQKYLYLIEGRKALAVMEETSTRKLQGMMISGSRREQEIQKKLDLMTSTEKEAAMRELQKLQENYQATEQREMAAIQEQQQIMNEKLYLNIQQVLDEYCEKNHIDYVYNFQKGGPFLYVNKSNDITVHVLTTLNERYQKQGK